MVTQTRINFEIEITLVAVKFYSQVLFYNVDFEIDLWICLKVTHITAIVLPQCCWHPRSEPPHPCFQSPHSCSALPEEKGTFIMCCFKTAINLEIVITFMTVIFIKVVPVPERLQAPPSSCLVSQPGVEPSEKKKYFNHSIP